MVIEQGSVTQHSSSLGLPAASLLRGEPAQLNSTPSRNNFLGQEIGGCMWVMSHEPSWECRQAAPSPPQGLGPGLECSNSGPSCPLHHEEQEKVPVTGTLRDGAGFKGPAAPTDYSHVLPTQAMSIWFPGEATSLLLCVLNLHEWPPKERP